jgi:hypothetical protein
MTAMFALSLQRHLIYSLAPPALGGVVTSPFYLTLMLSNHHWTSIPCFLGGGLPHPEQRVRDRCMTLLRVKLRPENLFSALIMASATLCPLSLPQGSPRRAEGSRRYLDRV